MFFSGSKKKTAMIAPIHHVIIHLYALGGSGAILAMALIICLLAMDHEDAPRIDLRLSVCDFDVKSDAQELLRQTVEVLAAMLTELSHKQEAHRLLGALRSISIANAPVLNDTEFGETVESCIRKLAISPRHKAELKEGLQILAEEKTRNIQLGSGAYGSPVAGAVITAAHASGISAVVSSQLAEEQRDNTATHIHLVAAGLGGSATGFSLLPEVLRNLSGHANVFLMADGGVFLPHSSVFSMSNYQGTRFVAEKADSALNGLYRQGLLDNVKGVVLRPLNLNGAAHKLCAQCKLEGSQNRHTSIEYLLGAEQIMHMIAAHEDSKSAGIVDLTWNPDMEERPLGWDDMGMDGVRYHRLLRKLAIGAATGKLIWSKDDNLIRNIPAISGSLRKGFTMAEIKEVGNAVSTVCHGLVQMFWDFAVTGSNLENLDTDLFTVEDRYRLLNLLAVEEILNGDIDAQFALNKLSCYREASKSGKEKTVQIWNGKTTVKKAVDSTATTTTPIEFYIQLFRSVS